MNHLYEVYMKIDTGADRYNAFRYVLAPSQDVAKEMAIEAIDNQYHPEYNTIITGILSVDMSTLGALPNSRY